jgi:hypothetical protein
MRPAPALSLTESNGRDAYTVSVCRSAGLVPNVANNSLLDVGPHSRSDMNGMFRRRSREFRRIAPQHVAHASGWEVFGVDRLHLGHRDGATIEIFTNSLQSWEPPNQAEPLPAAKRQEIIERIAASIFWVGERFKLL